MLLKDLMADYTPNAEYKGEIMTNDMVLAVNVSGNTGKDNVPDYAVVQDRIVGVNSTFNASTNDKEYIRSGPSSTKKSTQRQFAITGDRFIGDEAQDFLIGLAYKNGQDAIVDYVYFNLKNGKGEKGTASVTVNSDGSGNAGENAGIDINLSKNGAQPADYVWSPAAGASLDY